ncbi:helix-turn-helix domain-containing protein [Paenibacillus taichungensis]
MNTLGERVKALRNKQNLSMEALANRLLVATYDNETGEFVSYKKSKSATISNIENNKNRPSVDLALAIADYFEVSIDWLIRGKGTPTRGTNLISVYSEGVAKENDDDDDEQVVVTDYDRAVTDAALRVIMANLDNIMKEATDTTERTVIKFRGTHGSNRKK